MGSLVTLEWKGDWGVQLMTRFAVAKSAVIDMTIATQGATNVGGTNDTNSLQQWVDYHMACGNVTTI